MLRNTNEVSIPRRRTASMTPANDVGACSIVTRNTEPGRILSGCLCENRVANSCCLSGVGKVLCRCSMRPLPLQRGSGGDSNGGSGVMTLLEKGYDSLVVEN